MLRLRQAAPVDNTDRHRCRGSHAAYLDATGRGALRRECDAVAETLLRPDVGCQYDRTIEVDLATIEPRLNGPHSPDAETPLSQMKAKAAQQQWPRAIGATLIGSCTNRRGAAMGGRARRADGQPGQGVQEAP